MLKAVVVGAGVLGATVALRLAQGGAAVTVVEAGRAGGGTSATSFAWLNAANKKPRPYFDLNVAGMAAHRALALEFGDLPWLHRGGRLEWIPEGKFEAANRAFDRLSAWGYSGGWVSTAAARGLEPDLDEAALADCTPAFFPQEGWIDPVLYVRAMLRSAEQNGAQVRQGARVDGLVMSDGRVAGVDVAGERLFADVVVNCAGAEVNALSAEVAQIPMASTTGVLAFTPPVAALVSRIIAAPGVSLRPDGGGRLMVHSGAADATAATRGAGDLASVGRQLAERLRILLPCVGSLEMEAIRVTQRPIPADGYPVVGPWPGVEGYYVAVSHSAVTLAPSLGPAVAAELLGGEDIPELCAYRPDRMLAANAAAPDEARASAAS